MKVISVAGARSNFMKIAPLMRAYRAHDNLEPIIRKIHAALNPGGVYVSLAEGLTHERTRPTFLINAMLATSLTSPDVMFEKGQIAQTMRRAGFKSVQTRVPKSPQFYGPPVVDIARK